MTGPGGALAQACCDRLRRAEVALRAELNGIDWLEVLDTDAPPGSPRQRTLLLHLLKPVDAALAALIAGGEAVAIDGGARIPARAEWAAPALAPPASALPAEAALFAALPDAAQVIAVRTDTSGDAGDYRLRLRRSAADDRPPPGFDPVLSGIDFRFKVECPQDFDCLEAEACPPAPAAPEPDTLARDYDGFRRLLTGRLRALLPQWEGASPADLGVTLVEALAYAGDQLSYRLDAVGAEAYLETARHRSSLRRHALLVDYHPSEGTNARTLVQLELAEGEAAADIPLAGLAFATAPRPLAGRVPPDPANPRFRALAEQQPVWFEPIDPAGRVEPLESLDPPAVIRIDPRHHQMRLHDWGDGRCRLPAGATAATLRGAFPGLNPGDLLVLEEVIRRADGRIERGDPARRAAVRLLAARVLPPGDPEADPLIGDAVTEIAWHADDALPCALRIAEDVGGGAVFTVARGNMLLADEGRSAREPLPPPPSGWLRLPDRPRGCCAPPDQSPAIKPVRYRPRLAARPVFAATVRGDAPADDRAFPPGASAAAMLHPEAGALPRLRVEEDGGARHWSARPDLLLSGPEDPHLVVEPDAGGRASLRFGDDTHGARPSPGASLAAHYRTGGGAAGNIGADRLLAAVTADARIAAVRNPLAATGGAEPESAAAIRRRAPRAFLRQKRAVTLADWEREAGRLPGVQRAAAISRWTGSWRTAVILPDRTGGGAADAAWRAEALGALDRFRIATRDLAIGSPRPVTLRLKLHLCIADGAVRADVEEGVRRALGSSSLPDGRRGHFHPDRWSFGQAVELAPIYAAARAIPGVDSVQALAFGRLDAPGDPAPLAAGRLVVGPTEIAELLSDPRFPGRGMLDLVSSGGR